MGAESNIKKCRNCKRETNRIYAGLCVPCRGIEAERRERIQLEKESELGQYYGVRKITMEDFAMMVKVWNDWGLNVYYKGLLAARR